MKGNRPVLPLLVCPSCAIPLSAADPRRVFPVPFVVEHHVETTDGNGDRSVTETVSDTNGRSWVVSVHPSGLRTLVDLARRELTEVNETMGTYWTLSFGRMRELRHRISSPAKAHPRRESVRPSLHVPQTRRSLGPEPAPPGSAAMPGHRPLPIRIR